MLGTWKSCKGWTTVSQEMQKTQKSSWHCRSILPHTSSSTQHPEISTHRAGRIQSALSWPYLPSFWYPVTISSCPAITNAHKCLYGVVSFQTCLYCGNKNHELHMPCFSIHSLALHPPPACCPLQQSHLSSTVSVPVQVQHWEYLPYLPLLQGSKTTGTQQTIQL